MTIYLYIKQHSITKLKYFGKTSHKNPYKYFGSGKYWLKHLKKHKQEFVETLEVFPFENQEEATEFALKFSRENNIVESKEWANLKEENALDGNPIGNIISNDQKIKLSLALKGKKRSLEARLRMSLAHPPLTEENRQKIIYSNKTRKVSQETRLKMSLAKKGKKLPKRSPEHCMKISIANKGHIVTAETIKKIIETKKKSRRTY